MRHKSCQPGSDCCVVSGLVDGSGNLILTLASGAEVKVGQVPVAVADGVTVTGRGAAADPLKAGALVDNGDGTYTWVAADGAQYTQKEPQLVDNDDGSYTYYNAGHTQAILIKLDGKVVQAWVAPLLAPALAYDEGAGTLTLQPSADAGNHFQLGTDGKPYTAWPSLPTDVRLAGVSYNKKTKKLTFTLSDDTTLGPVDVSDLLLVQADGVTVTGDGTSSNVLKAGALKTNGAQGASGLYTWTGADGTGFSFTTGCPDDAQVMPGSAFVDLNQPTLAEIDAWVAANGPFAVGTPILYPLTGTVADPDYVWLVGSPLGAAGTVTNVESPARGLQGLTNLPGAQARVGAAGSATGEVLNVPNPLPVAQIVRTSKLGLTATFDGSWASGTQEGNSLTYGWTATAGPETVGTVTLGAAGSPTTTAIFSAPGEYSITLTVTDANGNTATAAQPVKVQRLIEVGGITVDGNDYVATLGAAVAWVTAHGSPAATAPWRIDVLNDTVELAQVNIPSYVHVFIAAGVQIAGSFGGLNGIGLVAATDASLNGVLTERPNILMTGFPNNAAQYAAGIFGVVGAGVSMTGIHAKGARGIVVNASGAPVLVAHCRGVGLHGNGFGAQKAAADAQTARHRVRDCEFYGGPDDPTHAYAFSGGDCLIEFVNCNFYGYGWQDGAGGASVGGVQVYASTHNDLVFDRCSIYSNGVGAAYRNRSTALDRANIVLLNSAIRARNGTAAAISDVVAWANAKIYHCVLQGTLVNVTIATPAAVTGSNLLM